MASIFCRLNKDGSRTFRVLIRRKGCPLLCLSFLSEKEAKSWVKNNEQEFINNPSKYLKWNELTRLNRRRKREFERLNIPE